MLAALALLHSPQSSASSYYWDLYCKQSGASNVNANCTPAEEGDWVYSGSSANWLVSASGMDSFAAVTESLESQLNEKYPGYCSPFTVTADGEWVLSTNTDGLELWSVPLNIERGVERADGSCERVGGTWRNGASMYRNFSCKPGQGGPLLGPYERFCVVYEPDKCSPSTPNPVRVADGEKHFRHILDAPVLGRFFFNRSYSSEPSYLGTGMLNAPRERGFTAGWALRYEAAVVHTTNGDGTNDVYTVAIPGASPLSFLEQESGEMGKGSL